MINTGKIIFCILLLFFMVNDIFSFDYNTVKKSIRIKNVIDTKGKYRIIPHQFLKSEKKSYEYVLIKKTYRRIRERISFEGNKNTSKEVNFASTYAYPIPASDFINLKITSKNAVKASIEIFSVVGNNIFCRNIYLNPGENIFNFDLTNIGAGSYCYIVKYDKQINSALFVIIR